MFDNMYEWFYAIQYMIDWIDEHAVDNPSLEYISQQVGYSPYYCSVQFHRVTGMTIKTYMAKRRLAIAAIAIRDTKTSLTDIALETGFSSQAALTRAFMKEYGCTPAAYRKNSMPITLSCRKVVLTPAEYISRGEQEKSNIVIPTFYIERIPAHKYLGVYSERKTVNGEIWAGHDCDLAVGIVSSLKLEVTHSIVTPHTAGWVWKDSQKTYFYGSGVVKDYDSGIPEGFELRGEFPESEYLVFGHPPFHYLAENIEVMKRVEELAWNFDPHILGYEWNEEVCQDYQRHYPEGLGYQILRPIRKI